MLPFANMSVDADQDFFSDGIADDLITDLTKVSGLFVASRHTAFALKGLNLDAREAGSAARRPLHRSGSIRKAGGRIRLTAQLIDTDSGEYLWAERYDRVLTDVFAVQDEITRSIVEALKVKLLPSEGGALRKAPTGDIDAYQLYLRGQQLFRQRTEHAYEVARRLFAQAVDLDREFARAHAGIAECDACLALHHGEPLPNEDDPRRGRAGAEAGAEPRLRACRARAGAGCPGPARRGGARLRARDRARAGTSRRPLRLCPRLLPARAQGRTRRGCSAGPPRCGPSDMFSAADPAGDRERAGAGRPGPCHRPAPLGRAEQELERQPESGRAAYAAAAALAALGDREGALRFAGRALALDPDDHPVQYNVACTYARLGELDMALDVLERTMPTASAYRWAWLDQDADLDPLREHPRFQALLRRRRAGPR